MKHLARTRSLNFLLLVFVAFSPCSAWTLAQFQETKPTEQKPKDERGLGLRPTPASSANQTRPAGSGPEIVLQAGITSPQTQISFSPDGRLLASMAVNGNAIKLWDVATGRVLRQLESSIPSMGAGSITRPFRFSADGQTLIALADGRIRRWAVETGRELSNTPLRDAKDILTALLSDDARIVAADNLNSSALRLWDAATAAELRSITFESQEHIDAQDAFALSPDGRLVAALTETVKASRKGVETRSQIAFWEVGGGRKAQTISISSGPTQFGVSKIASLAFSGDGVWIALRDEASLRIWDVATAREVKSFSPPRMFTSTPDPAFLQFAIKFLFSPDRRFLSVVTEGNKINLIDASSAATVHTLAGHKGNVVAVSFSADGKLIASSGTDNQIKLWDAASGNEVRTLGGSAMPISDVAFSEDGKSLVVAGNQATNSWELMTGGVRRTVLLPDDFARTRPRDMHEHSCLLSPDGKLLIAGSDTAPVARIWEVATGRELPEISLTKGKELASAVFSFDGSVVALVERDNQKPGRPSTQAPTQTSPNTPQPGAIALPDMSKIMEQMRKDPKKMQEQLKKVQEAMSKGDMSAGIDMMQSMGVIPGASKTTKSSNSLRIVDVASGRQLQSIALPGGFLNDIAANSIMSGSALSFSPDGRVLASSSGFSAPITLRDVSTGQELRTLKTNLSMSVYGLAWSPDGKRLASAHWGIKRNLSDPNVADGFSFEDITFTIKVWDAQTGTELNTLAGHNNFVNGLAFSRDGRTLASGSYDSTIKLWDLATGRELRTLKGHNGSISALDFSSDGRFVISGSDDGSARLWSAKTGEMLATLVSLNKGDDWLVVTPDGVFDGSPGGWSQILWRFTQKLFDVSPVEIFFNEYFHPGLLPDILAGRKVAVSGDISQKDRRQPKLSLDVANPASGARTLNIRINITDAPAGAQDLRLFRNGSLVKVWRGDVLKGASSATLDATVTAVAGRNQLTAYAFNRDNVKSTDATLSVTGADSLKRAATLHLVVVGVNEYENAGYDLKYAAADARAFGEEVERQQRKLGAYAQVEVTSLIDRDATKANLLNALERLSGATDAKPPRGATANLDRIHTSEPEDAVVVYYAGHGTAQGQRFYLIPHDLGYKGARTELDESGLNTILAHSISDLELEQAFEGIDATHLLMVIDACNSGQALEAEEKRRGPMNSKGLAQLAYEKGMYILTAAQSYQAAMEAEQLGHGYLTFALVEEGLKSAAADTEPKDGRVLLREWLDYATVRVPRMQEARMRDTRGLKKVAFVEGEERVTEPEKRNVQRPRVFYRREPEAQQMIVAKP